ncbi:MAG TPA: VPDSG-CTERM sorting domain-containing protein [Verrucomicrobiota bacterium]|nr:VPDSG-CTERM sorting domain-containing protein [Verrucomicrobiota bacterium]
MKESFFAARLALLQVLAVLAVSTLAFPVTGADVSTGDLGNNVINDAGDYVWNAPIVDPSGLASLSVKYGLWNSPAVDVFAYVNGTQVGNFLADSGYIFPGPEFANFDISGLLVNGLNEIKFSGLSANVGDYVIGQVDIRYQQSSSVPDSGSTALLLLGSFSVLLCLHRSQRERATSR